MSHIHTEVMSVLTMMSQLSVFEGKVLGKCFPQHISLGKVSGLMYLICIPLVTQYGLLFLKKALTV